MCIRDSIYCGYGQLPDNLCSKLEPNNSNARQCYHDHGKLPDRGLAKANKKKTLDGNTVVMASCLTLSVLRRNALKLDTFIVVMSSYLTMAVPSRNRTVAVLDSVITVKDICLTEGLPTRTKKSA